MFANRPLFEHLDEGGDDLEPYLHLLPGGKYGTFFQEMLDLYYYMLMLAHPNSIDDNIVNKLKIHLKFNNQIFIGQTRT